MFISLSDVSQHLECNNRLLVLRCITTRCNNGDRVLAKKGLVKYQIASGGDGKADGEGVHIGHLTEQLAKLQTTAAKNVNIRLAVTQAFCLEIEDVVAVEEIVVPHVEFLAITRFHSVWIIELSVRKRSNVALILGTVKEVWKETFFQLCETKRFWKISQSHRDEA